MVEYELYVDATNAGSACSDSVDWIWSFSNIFKLTHIAFFPHNECPFLRRCFPYSLLWNSSMIHTFKADTNWLYFEVSRAHRMECNSSIIIQFEFRKLDWSKANSLRSKFEAGGTGHDICGKFKNLVSWYAHKEVTIFSWDISATV